MLQVETQLQISHKIHTSKGKLQKYLLTIRIPTHKKPDYSANIFLNVNRSTGLKIHHNPRTLNLQTKVVKL